jgi:hypothetical protein
MGQAFWVRSWREEFVTQKPFTAEDAEVAEPKMFLCGLSVLGGERLFLSV